MYEFAWASPLFGGRLGACHGLEIGFVFDTIDEEEGELLYGAAPPAEVAAAMHKAWIDFARSGQPGWDPYTPANRATMTFALTSTLNHDPRHEQRIAWEGIR